MLRGFFRRMEQAVEESERKKSEAERQTIESDRKRRQSPEATERRVEREKTEAERHRKAEQDMEESMSTDRNLADEMDYLSGAMFAQETLLTALIKALVARGMTSKDNQRRLINDLLSAEINYPESPEFGVGYRETLEKLQEKL